MKNLLLILILSFFSQTFLHCQWTNDGINIYTSFNGNIGFGTPGYPDIKFDVRGNSSSDILMRMWNLGNGGSKLRYVSSNSSKSQIQFTTYNYWIASIGANTDGLSFNVNDYSVTNSENSLNDSPRIFIKTNGNVGIGTVNPSKKLSVNGSIESTEIQVRTSIADYVFYPEYKLMPLEELEKYIQENNHLPNVQSQTDVDKNDGFVKLGELNVSLLEKIEELTLYIFQLNERIKKLENMTSN
jgi:hypothetical protein